MTVSNGEILSILQIILLKKLIDRYHAIVGLLPTSQPTLQGRAKLNHYCHALSVL